MSAWPETCGDGPLSTCLLLQYLFPRCSVSSCAQCLHSWDWGGTATLRLWSWRHNVAVGGVLMLSQLWHNPALSFTCRPPGELDHVIVWPAIYPRIVISHAVASTGRFVATTLQSCAVTSSGQEVGNPTRVQRGYASGWVRENTTAESGILPWHRAWAACRVENLHACVHAAYLTYSQTDFVSTA